MDTQDQLGLTDAQASDLIDSLASLPPDAQVVAVNGVSALAAAQAAKNADPIGYWTTAAEDSAKSLLPSEGQLLGGSAILIVILILVLLILGKAGALGL